jgi:hypothetical protein
MKFIIDPIGIMCDYVNAVNHLGASICEMVCDRLEVALEGADTEKIKKQVATAVYESTKRMNDVLERLVDKFNGVGEIFEAAVEGIDNCEEIATGKPTKKRKTRAKADEDQVAETLERR